MKSDRDGFLKHRRAETFANYAFGWLCVLGSLAALLWTARFLADMMLSIWL